MLLKKDDTKWLKRGRQRGAVVHVLRKPMTASEICRAAHPINPHLQLRDVWFIMGRLEERGLVKCLNPRHATGKVYALTSKGRKVAEQAFGTPVARPVRGVDWRRYAKVVRAKVREAVLLQVACLPPRTLATATVIRETLREQRPIGLNPTMRAQGTRATRLGRLSAGQQTRCAQGLFSQQARIRHRAATAAMIRSRAAGSPHDLRPRQCPTFKP